MMVAIFIVSTVYTYSTLTRGMSLNAVKLVERIFTGYLGTAKKLLSDLKELNKLKKKKP